MTGLELVLAALTAGAAAGITDATSSSVKDAYLALREAVRRKLARDGGEEAPDALDAVEVEPDVWEARLSECLVAAGADRDEQILLHARELLAALDPTGHQAGKFTVDARKAKGVQIGDHTTQTNTFS